MTRIATIARHAPSRRPGAKPQPAWEIARLFPDQGAWTEDDYLELDTNHLIELTDGFIEVLPMPTTSHQLIVSRLTTALATLAAAGDLGTVLFAPLRVRLRRGKYREPDVVFLLKEHEALIGEQYWEGADLVMEVVSDDPESRERDLRKKRRDYALAGIREYWIVDPQEERIIVLRLSGRKYLVHGSYGLGDRAESALLKGFGVGVDVVLAPRSGK